jgi:Dockerin type I domain
MLSFDFSAADKPEVAYTFQLEAKADNLYPWRNRKNDLDVDNDGSVSPLDVLVVTNEINANGTRKLDAVGPKKAPFYYYDANGDGSISPLDILTIVNFINGK